MENGDFIIEKDRRQFIDVVKLLPDRMPTSEQKVLFKELVGKLIEISTSKEGTRNSGRIANPITVNRFIPLSNLLFEGLGLLKGDGIKFINGKFKMFGFCNSEITLHKRFLQFSKECFGLKSELFNARLGVPLALDNKIHEFETLLSEELNIPLNNFNKPEIRKLNRPCLDITFCSIMLGTIAQFLIEEVDLLSNKEFVASFLRGLIASEGSVDLESNGKLGTVSISAKEKSERELIRKLLKFQPCRKLIIN